ncbi:hypothetical protein C0Q70_13044 [Pomacea canaliculata]|uniref:Uncharacterized protein n=1 Tax=Pomacea canaliculata TaxID=400727 RepID=A0A2T7NW35_POMCA|nr:uncharacterized protein LOC112570834 [Pomacea canaliculata]PVD25388.1 hypothetical protein C0Q70_13044 [Pomacea canaliculata]
MWPLHHLIRWNIHLTLQLLILLRLPHACTATANVASQVAACDRPWVKVFENDEQGTPVFGEKQDLKMAVLRGATIRVLMHDFVVEPGGYATHSFTSGVDNINIRGDEICAEIINHIAVRGCEFVENAHYRHFLPCTSGNVHVAQYLVESPSFLGQDTQKVRISWFAKEIQADIHNNKPFYGHFLDGGATVGNKEELLEAAKEGKDIRALMTDRGYGFPLHVVMWSRDGRVAGQSNMHLSQKYSGNNIVYNTQTPYRWMSSWSTNGRRTARAGPWGSHQPGRGQITSRSTGSSTRAGSTSTPMTSTAKLARAPRNVGGGRQSGSPHPSCPLQLRHGGAFHPHP